MNEECCRVEKNEQPNLSIAPQLRFVVRSQCLGHGLLLGGATGAQILLYPILTLCLRDQTDDEEDEEEASVAESQDTTSDSDTEGADLSHVSSDTEDETKPTLFLKCKTVVKHNVDDEADTAEQEVGTEEEEQQTELTMGALADLEARVKGQLEEIQRLEAKTRELEVSWSEQVHSKVERLKSQNSVLKEKSSDIRSENDRLVAKIQTMQSRLSHSASQEVRVSVSEFEDGDADDIFTYSSSPQSRSPTQLSVKISSADDIIDDEKRFEEAAEKIMRLEQRVTCLQTANNVNSCATCRPLRSHVMKIEQQLAGLAQERRGQLEELYDLKQEALSSAVSEKDAHLQWLEVAGEGSSNMHTRGTLDRLRRERRDLLNRMKEENEVRMAMLSELDGTASLFMRPGKMTTLGSLHRGESLVSDGDIDADSTGIQSTSSLQSASTGEEGERRCVLPFVTDPRLSLEENEEDRQSSKSF